MKTFIFTILLGFCGLALAATQAVGARGMLRMDLVGKQWNQLPSRSYPDFTLPLPWNVKNKYELRHFQPDFGKRIVTVVELSNSHKKNDNSAMIISALDFSDLKEGEIPEQDCYYVDKPRCDGRLCNGLLIGVIDQKVRVKDGAYKPSEIWKITVKTLKFEKISTKNIICRPQSYAN